jgi:hypothetical protein
MQSSFSILEEPKAPDCKEVSALIHLLSQLETLSGKPSVETDPVSLETVGKLLESKLGLNQTEVVNIAQCITFTLDFYTNPHLTPDEVRVFDRLCKIVVCHLASYIHLENPQMTSLNEKRILFLKQLIHHMGESAHKCDPLKHLVQVYTKDCTSSSKENNSPYHQEAVTLLKEMSSLAHRYFETSEGKIAHANFLGEAFKLEEFQLAFDSLSRTPPSLLKLKHLQTLLKLCLKKNETALAKLIFAEVFKIPPHLEDFPRTEAILIIRNCFIDLILFLLSSMDDIQQFPSALTQDPSTLKQLQMLLKRKLGLSLPDQTVRDLMTCITTSGFGADDSPFRTLPEFLSRYLSHPDDIGEKTFQAIFHFAGMITNYKPKEALSSASKRSRNVNNYSVNNYSYSFSLPDRSSLLDSDIHDLECSRVPMHQSVDTMKRASLYRECVASGKLELALHLVVNAKDVSKKSEWLLDIFNAYLQKQDHDGAKYTLGLVQEMPRKISMKSKGDLQSREAQAVALVERISLASRRLEIALASAKPPHMATWV